MPIILLMSGSDKVINALKEFLSSGREWARKPVASMPGVFILKIPGSSRRPATLALEINPIDEFGNPTKRRGLIIRNYEELESFRLLINERKLDDLAKMVDEVNPKIRKRRRPSAEEPLEL